MSPVLAVIIMCYTANTGIISFPPVLQLELRCILINCTGGSEYGFLFSLNGIPAGGSHFIFNDYFGNYAFME